MTADPRIGKLRQAIRKWLPEPPSGELEPEDGDELDAMRREFAALEETLRAKDEGQAAAEEQSQEILDVLLGLGELDFSRRAPVGEGAGSLEAIAASVNMLAEEVEASHDELERRAEELDEQSTILRAILDSMAEGVVVRDGAGKDLLVNRAAERLIRRPPGDREAAGEGAGFGYFFPDEETPFPSDELPISKAVRGESTDDVEIVVRNASHPDGVSVSVSGRPIYDEVGRQRGGLVVVRDVTRAKRAQEELERAARRGEAEDVEEQLDSLATVCKQIRV